MYMKKYDTGPPGHIVIRKTIEHDESIIYK